MALKAQERSALLRILDSRFAVLDAETEQRRQELEILVRERVMERHAAVCSEAVAEVTMIEAEINVLIAKVPEIVARFREQGIVPGSFHVGHYESGSGKAKRSYSRIETWANDSHHDRLLRLETKIGFTPINPQGEIDDELRKLLAEAGRGRTSLRKMRAELEEKILLGDITSEEGRSLLGEIPDVDKVLPPIDEVRALLTNA